jgi:hypothetical protein
MYVFRTQSCRFTTPRCVAWGDVSQIEISALPAFLTMLIESSSPVTFRRQMTDVILAKFGCGYRRHVDGSNTPSIPRLLYTLKGALQSRVSGCAFAVVRIRATGQGDGRSVSSDTAIGVATAAISVTTWKRICSRKG